MMNFSAKEFSKDYPPFPLMDFSKSHERSNFPIFWSQKIDALYYQKSSPIKNTLFSMDIAPTILNNSKYSRFFSKYYAIIQFHNPRIIDTPIAVGKVIDCILE